MTRPRLLYLNNTAGPAPPALTALPNLEVADVPQYGASLAGADIIYVPMHADQRDLADRGDLAEAVETGTILIVNGHVAHPFHPALTPFVPSPGKGLAALRVERLAPHPLFDDVPLETLNFTKGVAGFYARGGNPAPSGATIIHTVGPQKLTVDWLLPHPSGGALFVHAGNDIIPFLHRAGALKRFFDRIFPTHAHSA
ncbi:MAG: hypothetical protein AAF318_01525 [Pseudomonadota bacterium]